jgi:hypothetical protein
MYVLLSWLYYTGLCDIHETFPLKNKINENVNSIVEIEIEREASLNKK